MEIEWCTDNPPEDFACDYLVTLDTGRMYVCTWRAYFNASKDIYDWGWANKPQFSKVVAWMPLPRAYKNRHSKWIVDIERKDGTASYYCANCGHCFAADIHESDYYGFGIEDIKFCPHCGCEMW